VLIIILEPKGISHAKIEKNSWRRTWVYFSSLKEGEMSCALSTNGEMENTYSLVGKAERKRTLERNGRRWDVKITVYPIGTGL
jgi:hypothetical protein